MNPKLIKWLKANNLPKMTDRQRFPSSSIVKYQNMSPVEMFKLFITDDIIEHLCEETRRYALFINCPDPKITNEEIKFFLAILIVSGYDKKPSKKSYWDSGEDLCNTAVYNSMRHDRFIQIMRFMYCADNNNYYPIPPLLPQVV
ncbi:hypothetical protein NQ314_006149 [Rhamnusium bicolor]|uniref:PiggyBac transposable element-derived protein domain-containing protein n=1 Tax=Rhamnusium bicolor TaxID=1586634 RepID=A0AAV8Z6W9_9CUCU|nr:hypothetical protein NQ314_006149 [Rhamnusium bicolor]